MGGSISFPCVTNNPTPAMSMHHPTVSSISHSTHPTIFYLLPISILEKRCCNIWVPCKGHITTRTCSNFQISGDSWHTSDSSVSHKATRYRRVITSLLQNEDSSEQGIVFVGCCYNASACSCSNYFKVTSWCCPTPEELPPTPALNPLSTTLLSDFSSQRDPHVHYERIPFTLDPKTGTSHV